uniref:Si:ch211-106h11.3 n=1 Tax=Gasterosteus aculeatus TaxID=69293 RepID=G3NRT8_GASAC
WESADSMGILILLAVFQLATFGLVTAGCPVVCECPAGPASCPPGVSSVLDGCGCCKVCAAQLNQDCHEGRPCDHHRGLECNYGNDVGHTHGICRAKAEGRSCEYNGRIHQNGENFNAGCKHQCTCIDGAVGCVPLCPSHVPLASPSCPAPHLVKVPGQCCLTIDCYRGATAVPKREKDVLGNELVEAGRKRDKPRGNKHLAEVLSHSTYLCHPAFPSLYRPLYASVLPVWRKVGDQCVVQTTSWSQCSRSCGMGVSSRVTNDNARCKLIKETRLCNVRPCSSMSIPVKKGRKCSRTHKAPEPHRLSYAGCRSTRLYRPNYCGVCRDGRCCSPRRTRTAGVAFACPDGERFSRSVMFIQSCKCSDECNHLNEAAMPPQQWLYGDTHKFID